jgi:hypothetical protein
LQPTHNSCFVQLSLRTILLDILISDRHADSHGLLLLAHDIQSEEEASGPIYAILVLSIQSDRGPLIASCPDGSSWSAGEGSVMEPGSFRGECFFAVGVLECGTHGCDIAVCARTLGSELILGNHLSSWDGIWSIEDFCSLGSINDAKDTDQYRTVWTMRRYSRLRFQTWNHSLALWSCIPRCCLSRNQL